MSHLAREAVELDRTPEEEASFLDGSGSARTSMRSGRRITTYVDDATPLVYQIRALDPENRRAIVYDRQSRRRILGRDGEHTGGFIVSLSVPHALSVWRRNTATYRRRWKWNLFPNLFEPVLYLVSIGIGVGAYINQMGGTS